MSVQFTSSSEAPGLPLPVAAHRVSLIATTAGKASRDWKLGSSAQAVTFIDVPEAPVKTLRALLEDAELDLARLVVDGVIDNGTFLQVLVSMPNQSSVDILWITDAETAYLSSVGRGGDRVLYALTPFDVRFYLEVNDLVVERRILSARES